MKQIVCRGNKTSYTGHIIIYYTVSVKVIHFRTFNVSIQLIHTIQTLVIRRLACTDIGAYGVQFST